MKKEYEKSMLDKISKEMRLKKKSFITIQPIYGDKISIDGLEFFNSITGIKIFAYNNEIAEFDHTTKMITYKNHIRNIMVLKALIDVLNDFVQYEKYSIKHKYINDFEKYKDEVDPTCNLSDYEIACMYECI